MLFAAVATITNHSISEDESPYLPLADLEREALPFLCKDLVLRAVLFCICCVCCICFSSNSLCCRSFTALTDENV